ncbi:hypothetical protein [Lactococcus petauri]|uniref:Uncharacterized protein n=1 Tax=Lactococcus petauri TaxID=1940789 RepID=A0ABZ2SFH4_9LACT|nr:hypothetical protein [Lactococcus petauri]MCI3872058.1 hypothetical protein [Lactococcus petauri]MCQ8276531.1 hypothetical protein [Lactococcus petauri]MCR6589802.1 hypothetical protein [Lactococcus petauri]MCU7364488.1 hypothetical protein [Lactococcus petauri]MCV5952976.1 hypothetical protein [Lactococcus petauri]
MKKNGKYYVAGVLLIPGILGVVAYSSTYGTEDKKAGVKQEQIISTPVTQVSGANITALNADSTTNNYSGISPAIGLTTFKDTYKELEADADTLHIHTKSHGNGTAALQAYRQEISIDSDIADEFFNTKDFQKYISGTVERSKDSLLGGTKTMDIQKDLWDKSSWLNSETMNYDSKHKVIYYKTAQYTVQIASGIDIEVDMKIDLGQWAKDTGRLVERKPNYSITAKTDANSMAIGFTNKIVGSVSSDDILDSWIENPVEDTTLYYLTEKNSYFYGNGLQDEINEHPTDYDIELMVNGTPFKYIQMASEDGGTNSRGETIKKGDWDFDFGSYLNPGDVVTARVRGKEKYENINGVRPTKYSATTHASDATNIVSWEDWKVAEPSVPILYEDDLIIPFHAPVQNQQLNRSYKLIVTVNDQEVYNKAVKDETDTNVPYLSGLVEGDVVKAKIVGSQPGEPDKESTEITTVVTSQDNEGYDDWEVQKAVINGPLYEGATVISGYVPIQNRAAGRTYDLKVYIGDELVIDDKDIDVALKSYNYSYSLTDLKDLKEGTLNYGDKIKAVVTGHQPNGENNVVYDDKSVESELIVSDNTGYASWEVNKPQLNKMVDTDTVITGNIGEQNIEAGRTYKVALSIDGGEPIYVKPKADGSFELKEVVLKEGSQVSATVIGSQDNREDKESGATVETVTDATNYDDWEVNKPTVNALKDTDTEITGNIGEQNKEFGRTYDVEVFVNNISKGKAEVASDGSFKADKIVLNEDDKVTATVTGHQDGKADKTATSAEVIVSDASNYAGWKVNKPTVNALEDGKVAVTGTIGEQNKEFGRTYDVEVFVNGETQGAATVATDGTFATKEISLKEGDKVTATVTGHQSGKADKTATSDEVIVSDSSHYDEWTVAPASLDEVFAHADGITGELPKEDSSYGRNYEIIAKVDGEEVARNKVEANQGGYTIALPETVDLKEGQTVSVQVVGHQEGKEDKLSSETSVKVQEQVFTTASNFKNGYWQNYGLVYEGQIDNQGWDMSDGSRVTKTAQLVNHTTGEVVTEGIQAANTNWYDSSRYNGYQIIISNDVLSKLDAGEYTLQLTVAIDGETKETIDLALDQVVSFMGPMHDNYADLEEVVIERNTVTPKVIDNKPGFTITKDTEASVQVFNKYWNTSDQLVFEGYVNTSAQLTDVTKKLIIKDASGETVDTRNIQNFASSWGIPVDVDESQSFQAIVPNAYSDQAKYTYELVYTDADGKTLLTEVLK